MAFESPVIRTIEIQRGNSRRPKITVYLDEAAYDLTGKEIYFTVKRDARDADGAAVLAKTKSGGGIALDGEQDHVCYVTVTPADSRLFQAGRDYEWELKVATSDGQYVGTPMRGPFRVQREVLRQL